MDKKTIIKTLKENKDKLQEQKIKKIGLFGSYLKGNPRKNSDIDFLIKVGEISLTDYMKTLKFLEKLFKKNIDLVIEEDLKPELKYVKKEAQYVKI